LCSCQRSTPDADSNVITIATYGGGWAERIRRVTTAEMSARNITVRFVEANAQAAKARLIAARGGPPPFDLMELDDETYVALRRAGYLERFDLARIPRVQELVSGLHDEYRVPFWINQPGLIYNAGRFRAEGIDPPRRLSDFANPRLARRVMLGDLGHYTGLYGLAALIYENGGDDSRPQPGFDALARISPHSYFTSAALIGQLFETGELWAAMSTDGAAQRFQASGMEMGIVHLAAAGDRIMVARGYFGRPRGGRNPEAVEAFVNALISAEAQLTIGRETGMIPVHRDALREARTDQQAGKAYPFSILEEQALAQGYVPPYAQIDLRDWTRRFQSAVIAQPR
jgi:spermidine/putrescine-binding protein